MFSIVLWNGLTLLWWPVRIKDFSYGMLINRICHLACEHHCLAINPGQIVVSKGIDLQFISDQLIFLPFSWKLLIGMLWRVPSPSLEPNAVQSPLQQGSKKLMPEERKKKWKIFSADEITSDAKKLFVNCKIVFRVTLQIITRDCKVALVWIIYIIIPRRKGCYWYQCVHKPPTYTTFNAFMMLDYTKLSLW